VDIITSPETHARFVGLIAQRRVPVICQKPMAPTLLDSDDPRKRQETTDDTDGHG
jgi:predicted dehydrogenase